MFRTNYNQPMVIMSTLDLGLGLRIHIHPLDFMFTKFPGFYSSHDHPHMHVHNFDSLLSFRFSNSRELECIGLARP